MAEQPIRVTENPFGEFTEEQLAGQPMADRFYLAGYSDKRHERDLEVREARKAGREPKKMPPLERRFQYVSVERADKTPVGDKELEFRRLGYRVVKWDELASLGIDAENSGAKPGPEGTVRVGSQMLMVADAPVAARNFRDVREATERQSEAVRDKLQEVARRYNERHGHSTRGGTSFEFSEEEV
jgi:hypothetical protein